MNKQYMNRILLGTGLGVVFGLLCFAGFSSKSDIPVEMARWQVWSLGNAWMWGTIINRALLGMVVGLSGVIVAHPLVKIRIRAWLRGTKIGALMSLPMAVGSLTNPNHDMAVNGFWIVLIAGIVIGLLIDIIITKFTGEGKELCG
jgi:hypothetical protein